MRSALGTLRRIYSAAFLFAGLALPLPGSAVVYDLKTEWSDAANPNGVWTYREGTSALPSVADWTPIGATATQPAWAPGVSIPFIPAWVRSTTNNPSGIDVQLGDVFMHSTDGTSGPGQGVANFVWTAPASGSVDVSGAIWLARKIGRSNDWSVVHNTSTLTSGSVTSADAFTRATPMDLAVGSGGSAALQSISVAAGDEIGLVVAKAPASTFGELSGVIFSVDFTPTAPEVPVLAASARIGLSLAIAAVGTAAIRRKPTRRRIASIRRQRP